MGDASEQSLTSGPMASMVCIPCKKRKKGCDKKLPACSRCERLNANCFYPKEPWSNDSEPSFSASTSTLDRDSPCISSLSSPSSDEIAISALHMLVEHFSPNQAEEELRHYFSIQHINLPIINKEHFMWKFTQHSQEPHFLLLKIAISMIAQLTLDKTGAIQRGMNLYTRLKSVYSHYQTTTILSVDLLLTGLLIATYEFYQHLLQQSWLTVGACARIGQIILLEDHGSVIDHGFPVWWWGVVILERIIGSDFMRDKLPATSDSPQLTDYLPLMSIMDVPGRCVSHELYLANDIDEHSDFVPRTTNFTSLSPFSTTIQATYLNDLVTEQLFRGSEDFEKRRFETARLTMILKTYEGVLTPPPGDEVGHYCGAWGLQTCAIFRLHESELLHAERVGDLEQVARSKLVLQTISRMNVVGLRLIKDGVPQDMAGIALWSHKIIYYAAIFHIRYGVRDEDWASDLDRCKRYLRHLAGWMKLHEQYLRAIEDEELRILK